MQKTRLGISVGLLGAAALLTCFFGGYVAAFVLAGYVLLFEENAWLRRTAVKGVALMIGFSVLSAVINLIPNAITLINSICNLFDEVFYSEVVANLISIIEHALVTIEKLLFLALGLKALNQGTIKIPVIDSLINKYMG